MDNNPDITAYSYKKEPMEIVVPAPNGNYEVTLTVTGTSDTHFSVFTQTRRFEIIDEPIKNGEKKIFTFAVNVCDYHMHGQQPTQMHGVEIYILCDDGLTAAAAVSPMDMPTIYICGDSTVTDQAASYPYNPTSTYCGWGQMFPIFLDEKISVSNHAQSGSTTADCLETNFNAFKDKLKPGDAVIIEFGHNDQKVPSLDAFGGYSDNLKKLITLVKEYGASPILASSINRIIFQPDGHLLNLLGDYRNAVKAVCNEFNVPFIDLWSRTTAFFEKAGCVKAWDLFYSDENGRDYTHTNDIGGKIIASIAADEIIKINCEPIASHIKKNMISIPNIIADPNDKPDNNSQVLQHLNTIGLINTPGSIDDIDKDVTGNTF